jgi:hypothetical protein
MQFWSDIFWGIELEVQAKRPKFDQASIRLRMSEENG